MKILMIIILVLSGILDRKSKDKHVLQKLNIKIAKHAYKRSHKIFPSLDKFNQTELIKKTSCALYDKTE